jgi:hypothetical protein
MKYLKLLPIVVVSLLSIAAGAAKLFLAPQEVEFLQGIGLGIPIIVVFGAIQLLGGILLIPNKTRLISSVVVAIGFTISFGLILFNGDFVFAAVSIVPVGLALFILSQSLAKKGNVL